MNYFIIIYDFKVVFYNLFYLQISNIYFEKINLYIKIL